MTLQQSKPLARRLQLNAPGAPSPSGTGFAAELCVILVQLDLVGTVNTEMYLYQRAGGSPRAVRQVTLTRHPEWTPRST